MNITIKQILQHFLSQHLKTLTTAKVFEHDPFFDNYFTRSELIEIIKHTYGTEDSQVANQGKAWKSDMIEIINDSDILSFFLHKWTLESNKQSSFTAQNVHNTLEQLGQQLHYLNFKILADWDAYDHSNFNALLKKAGRLRKVFGFYDANIAQEAVESVTSPPARFFDSYNQAEEAFQELIRVNKMKSNEAHILFTYQSI